MMRRPEIAGFIALAIPANVYDFSFLAPCPASGLIVHGGDDQVVPQVSVDKLAQKLSNQKNITIDYRIIPGADHMFRDHMDDLNRHVDSYLDKALAPSA